MADELKARLVVDVSEFRAGMDQAAAAVRPLKDIKAQLKVATDNLADAELKLGKAAAEGNAQAAAVLQEYRNEIAQLTAELSQAASAVEQQVSATTQLATVETEETAVLRSNISARMAATAEIRLAEGGMQGLNRAAAAYLTTLPGVAAAASAAFAIAGPLAVLAVLGQMAVAIGGVVSAYREMTAAARESELAQIAAGDKEVKAKSKILSSTTLARIAHGGDVTQKDVDVQTFSPLHDDLQAQRQIAAARAQDNEAGLTGLALQQQRVKDKQEELTLLKQQREQVEAFYKSDDALLRATKPADHRNIFGKREMLPVITDENQVKAIEEQMRAAKKAMHTLDTEVTVTGYQVDAAKKKEPNAGAKDADKEARDRLRRMEEERVAEEEQGRLGAQADLDFWSQRLAAFKKGSEQYKAVLEKVVRDRQSLARSGEEYAAETARGQEMQAREAEALKVANIQFDLASGKITKLQADQRIAAAEAEEYTQKLAALRVELEAINNSRTLTPEDKRVKAKGVQNQIEQVEGEQAAHAVHSQAIEAKDVQDEINRQTAAQERLDAERTRSVEIEARLHEQEELQRIAIAETTGGMTHLMAAMQRGQVHADMYRAKLKALYDQLADLQRQAKDLRPDTPQYNENRAKQAQVQNQIKDVQGQGRLTAGQDSFKTAEAMAAPYVKAANTIEESFTRAFTQVAMRQRSWAQAMAGAVVNMELQAAAAVERWVIKQIDAEIITLAKRVLANQAKSASDEAAAAQQVAAAGTAQATVAVTNAANATSNAGAAATGAMAAVAWIPVVGPELAVAAAGTMAATAAPFIAMASFDVGTPYVPKTGVAMIHRGEQIVTEANNRELMEFVRGGRESSSVTHNTVHATVNQHFPQNSKPSDAARGIHDAYRRGKLRF